MLKTKQPGLYIISNENDKKVYIGSSVDLEYCNLNKDRGISLCLYDVYLFFSKNKNLMPKA